MQKKFTHLHLHTEFSMLDGSSKIKEVVSRVKELGMDSCAITDHGVMYGAIDFYKECKKNGIHPVIGCEVYVAPAGRLKKENKTDAANYHLVLLAKTQVGYENLAKMVSFSFMEGFYYKPRIDYELLEKYSEGIIALSACLGGEIPRYIKNNEIEKAKQCALRYQDIFGKGNFYIELQKHGLEQELNVNRELIKMSKELDIPMVVTNDSHYTYEDDAKSHDVLLCIQTNKKVSDQDRMRYVGGQFYLKSPDEMYELFPQEELKKAYENTYKIAHECNVEFEFGKNKIPEFEVEEGYSTYEYLEKLCEDGLKERYKEDVDKYRDRLEYELNTIKNMGYIEYFLIVWDFIKFAKDNGIMVGPGRGSAAGSIVAYVLKITDIDPIKYNLIFERFLNPERVSMPDIDVDFCYERRQEVIDYVNRKYGKEQVAQIVTFGTMAAKAVIRDVGRAYDIPYVEVDRIAKMIPNELKMTIDKALKLNKEFRDLYETDVEVKKLIDTSKRLEGLTRHSSVHAAGVVICDRPVYDYVPLSGSDGVITTQFTMTTLEELGLLKMDFLGLRTLTVIRDAIDEINKNSDMKIDINNIDYDDSKVYELLATGKTEGVFQLESEGMQSFMKELKPQSLEDVIAGISLYRPGPMSSIPTYVKGRHHPEDIGYITPELEHILKPTYGCIVYQEQVMQIVRDLAGYTLGRSDLVRRAMSKKKLDVMDQERKNFIYGNKKENIKGCINNGISEDAAKQIYDDMEDFAKYAFNKSHAAAYAVVAYQTAFLKCYYPVEFMAALITSVINHPNKMVHYMLHLKELGIKLLPPDINEGYPNFSVVESGIRFGFCGIKNVGKNVAQNIVIERNKNGLFKSLTDYCKRMESKDLNKRCIENFVKSGVFDSLGGNRKQYMEIFKVVLDSIVHERRNVYAGQIDLFSMGQNKDTYIKDNLPNIEEFTDEEKLAFEKEAIAIYISGHPLKPYEGYLAKRISKISLDFIWDEEEQRVKVSDYEKVIVAGIVRKVTRKTTRNNQMMAFLELEDMYGVIEIIVFSKVYEKYKDIIEEDKKLILRGRVTIVEESDAKIILEKVEEINSEKVKLLISPKINGILWIKLTENFIRDIQDLLNVCENGESTVMIYEEENKTKTKYYRKIILTEELIKRLKLVAGEENIIVK